MFNTRFLKPLILLCSLSQFAIIGQAAAPQSAIHFASPGVKLPGPQFQYDAGFDLLDFNGDGKLDLFLPNTGMISFVVHQNEGTKAEPRFGHAVHYPVNLTETSPQTVEHMQSYAINDLNHDGLFDLVVFDGQLRYIPNTGTAHGPNHWHLMPDKARQYFPGSAQMIKENARYATGPESMYWNKGIFGRQAVTFTIADWDGDGLEDLLISRFKAEAPGVKSAGGTEQWTPLGRRMISKPRNPAPAADEPKYQEPLKVAPAREFYFYKNTGTKEKPYFDKGMEITTPDGKSIAAPNPVVADIDGDGVLDIVSSETQYSCNGFRVDWPTDPNVVWYRRVSKGDVSKLAPAQPVMAAGQSVPAGTMAKLADFRGVGTNDLFVMDAGHKGTLRWYQNASKPGTKPAFGSASTLHGADFLRFDFMAQPLIVDWFGKGSRDLIIHGNTDAGCKWSLRRTTLYRNVATKPGEIKYEFAGWFDYKGDQAMVPTTLEERPYDIYGSALSVLDDGSGKKRLVMSVNGQLYLFSDLAKDGLSFQSRKALPLKQERNRMKGWQEIPVNVPEKVQYIRIGDDPNGMGNGRDGFLNIVNFEALSNGKNVATVDQGVQIKAQNDDPHPWYQVQRPDLMFTPGNAPRDDKPGFTSWGYYMKAAVITLKKPVQLDKIRFLLSNRDALWYDQLWPFYWQGKLYHFGGEEGELWYNYKVEVSADGKQWTTVADRMNTEMMRTFPLMTDWNKDGKVDLVLGITNSFGIRPSTKEYRLYLNTGTNDDPKFDQYQSFADEKGKPLQFTADWLMTYGAQDSVQMRDMDGDEKPDLIVEGLKNSETLWYRNVSAQPGELKFAKGQALGDPKPITYTSRYRYFFVGDVDGDGVLDYINSDNASLDFFKGTHAGAPAAVREIKILQNGKDSLQLQWNQPTGATKYDIRWSRGEPITEANWATLPSTTGSYDAAEQSAMLKALPTGALVNIAIKSANEKGEVSPLSENVEAATSPLQMVVLRNGPADGQSVPEYSGTEATTLDAEKPGEAGFGRAKGLEVRAHSKNQKVILLRFNNLPKLSGVERATVELTTDPSLQADTNLFQPMPTLAVSCNQVHDDWQADKATWTEAAPGKPWGADELMAGGDFVSTAQIGFEVKPRQTIEWDATDAVRAAQKGGKDSLSLLIRADYTGYYIDNLGYNFAGPDFKTVELRPRLVLITKNS